MAHTKLILKHLEDFGSITAAEAVDNYGCYRLAARIADLKELGYEITSERERGKIGTAYQCAMHVIAS